MNKDRLLRAFGEFMKDHGSSLDVFLEEYFAQQPRMLPVDDYINAIIGIYNQDPRQRDHRIKYMISSAFTWSTTRMGLIFWGSMSASWSLECDRYLIKRISKSINIL